MMENKPTAAEVAKKEVLLRTVTLDEAKKKYKQVIEVGLSGYKFNQATCDFWENVIDEIENVIMPNDKPSWDNAPEWATYLAMDIEGNWYWYETKPFFDEDDYEWKYAKFQLAMPTMLPSAISTLEKRPE